MISNLIPRHVRRTISASTAAIVAMNIVAMNIVAMNIVAVTIVAPPVSAQPPSSVVVRDAWVREVPAGRTVTGAFMVLENTGTIARALVHGKASVGDTLELHEMKRTDGMMSMSPVQRIAVAAEGETALRPGGYHLMLFGLKKPLVVNDTIQLTLTFDDGSIAKVPAIVRSMHGKMP